MKLRICEIEDLLNRGFVTSTTATGQCFINHLFYRDELVIEQPDFEDEDDPLGDRK